MQGFKYWEAPEAEMKALLPGVRRCEFCGAEARCFDLSRAIRPSGTTATVGCMHCLALGHFGFFRTTALDYLDDEPTRVFVVDPSGAAVPTVAEAASAPSQKVAPTAFDELTHTPSFPTWNEVAWPVHCSDFMVYLGPWLPRDVRHAAAARNCPPVNLFVEMTGPEHEGLWTDDQEQWGFDFHVFRCTACKALRGAIDLD